MSYAKYCDSKMDITNHSDAKMFESWSIVLYVGDFNVKLPTKKE